MGISIQCGCVSIDHMHTTHSVHVHGREGGTEGGKEGGKEGGREGKIHYVHPMSGGGESKG